MKEMTYTVKIDANGDKFWYVNGELHRENGPACEYANGDKFWYVNGERHREDGPAMEFASGSKFWYVNGKELTEKEFNERNKKPCTNKVINIDRKNYKLLGLDLLTVNVPAG